MDSQQYSIIKQIFTAALEIPLEDRPAYLIMACAGNVALEAEVRSLLLAHEQAGRFIDPEDANDETLLAARSAEINLDRFKGMMRSEQLGSTIDRYKLLEVIGQGGYGIVFRAEQEHPVRRYVALKILKQGMESTDARSWFEAERQMLALIDHPNISKLFDAGTTEQGRPYFVMELVDGKPITRFCDERRLTIRQRVELLIIICRAVHHAHQKGIIHRDLKPSNILVADADGAPSPKVIDFGASQIFSSGDFPTEGQQILGTPQYMSPEQVTGGRGAIDIRSDVYSLGAMAYELLAGITPVDGSACTLAALQEIFRSQPFKSPSAYLAELARLPERQSELSRIIENRGTTMTRLVRSLKEDLDWIVMKAIHLSPASRYDSVAAMADDLQAYLDHWPVLAAPKTVSYVGRRFFSRNKTIVSLSVVVALSLVVGLYATAVSLIRTRAAEAITVNLKSDAVAKLRDSYLEQARTGEHSRLPGQRIQSLQAIAKAAAIAPPPEFREQSILKLRNQAIACMSLPDAEVVQQWDFPPAPEQFICHDRKMNSYAVAVQDGTIRIFRESDRAQTGQLRSPGYSPSGVIGFSPDGRYLYAGYEPVNYVPLEVRKPTLRFIVWNLETQRPVVEVDSKFAVPSADFSHDGKWIAFSQPPDGLEIHPLASAGEGRSIKTGGTVSQIAVRPGDQEIAIWATGAGIKLVSVGSNEIHEIPKSNNDVSAFAWHPDGQQLAIGHGPTGHIEIVNSVTGEVQQQLWGHVLPAVKLAFTHDGRFLASGGWDSRIRLWDISSGAELLGLDGFGATLQLADDDRLSFDNSSTHQVLKLVTGNECRALIGLSGDISVTSSDFSPDGTMLAAATHLGVRVWDTKSSKQLCFAACPGPRTVLFDRDGANVMVSTATTVTQWKTSELLKHHDPLPDLVSETRTCAMAATPDWKKLVFGNSDGAIFVGDPNQLSNSVLIGHQSSAPRFATISPDGAWVATSKRIENPNSFKVWNVAARSLARELPVSASQDETGQLAFSPDGKFLVTTEQLADTWYSVGDWKRVRRIDRQRITSGLVAFSPDGKLVALNGPGFSILIADATTGQERALIDTQIPHFPGSVVFSKDSSQLAVAGAGPVTLIWDLRLIRHQLALMNLDWH